MAAEGSTNWSTSGEGTFVLAGHVGGPGYKAQNNTQSIITDRDTMIRFQTELIAEHTAAQSDARQPGAKYPNKTKGWSQPARAAALKTAHRAAHA